MGYLLMEGGCITGHRKKFIIPSISEVKHVLKIKMESNKELVNTLIINNLQPRWNLRIHFL